MSDPQSTASPGNGNESESGNGNKGGNEAGRDQHQALLDALTAALRDGAPEGWLRVDLAARMLANVYESEVFHTLADGSTVPGPVDDPDLRALLTEHRRLFSGGMLTGAWFSLRLYVPRDGDWWLADDNRWEPHWRSPVPDSAYRADYELFPWNHERMPWWLPDKLLAGSGTDAGADPADRGPVTPGR